MRSSHSLWLFVLSSIKKPLNARALAPPNNQRLLVLRQLPLLQQSYLMSITEKRSSTENNGIVCLVVICQQQQRDALINLQFSYPEEALPKGLHYSVGYGRLELVHEIIDTIFAQQESHPWQA